MRRLLLKLRRRRNLQADLEAELAFHRDMAQASGNTIPLGNTTVLREQSFDLWQFGFLENLWRDARIGLRSLARDPVLVLSAMLSLGLGIGANTTLFSLAVEFLLSEPSVTYASTLAEVRLGGNSHAERPVRDFVQNARLFQAVAGYREEAVNWDDGAATQRIFAVETTRNYFEVAGVPLAVGRGYLESDPDEVVVLSHRFWQSRLNGNPAITGRSLRINGKAYTVTGVLPPNHRTIMGFGMAPDVYLPDASATARLAIVARMGPTQTRQQALASLSALGAHIDQVMPAEYVKYGQFCRVDPIAGVARLRHNKEFGTVGAFFLLLLILAGGVLLIACINVASLLLARAAARRRELAIRISVGAGRARLLQQLMVESLLLAVLGTAVGLGVARFAAAALSRIQLPLPVPVSLTIEPDWRVALYAALLTAVAVAACGLLPALQAVKHQTAGALHRMARQRMRRVLVCAQICVSLVVLVTSFLFVRNLIAANAISPGFDIHNTIRADVNLPPEYTAEASRIGGYVTQAVATVRTLPGIESVAAARIVPFTDASQYGNQIQFPDSGAFVRIRTYWNAVTPEYFGTLRIPIRQGRTFTPADTGANKVVIVNQAFVKRYLSERQPVGTRFLWGKGGNATFEIVGVVDNTKNITIGEVDEPQMYEPFEQAGAGEHPRVQLLIRSATPPASQLDAVRQALRKVLPAAGTDVTTLMSNLGMAFLPSQIGAALMGSLGALGLVLATVGLYGTLVYGVVRRTQEIAVRKAIGATDAHVARMVYGESLRLIGWGAGFGLVIAFFVTKPLAMFLVPGIEPADPLSFGAVAFVFVFTGALAAWGPSRLAAGIEPATAARVA